jgi:hypothetical protein
MGDSKDGLRKRDFRAADAVIGHIPDAGWEGYSRDDVRRQLAEEHAEFGTAAFYYRYGLIVPTNPLEELEAEFWQDKITSDEYERLLAEHNNRPIDEPLVAEFYKALERKFGILCRILAASKVSENASLEERKRFRTSKIDKLFRQLDEQYPFTGDLLERIGEFVEEVRVEQKLPVIRHHDVAFSTTILLCNKFFQLADTGWKFSKDAAIAITEEGQPRDMSLAGEYFHTAFACHLPDLNEFYLSVVEERAAVKRAIRSAAMNNDSKSNMLHGGNAVNVSPTFNYQPQVNVHVAGTGVPVQVSNGPAGQTASTEIAVESEPETVAAKGYRPELAWWAAGVESDGEWWLFRKEEGTWRPRRKIEVPSGNPEFALKLIASNGGSLDSSTAYKEFHDRDKGKTPDEIRRTVTDALSKAKLAIRKAIAESVRKSVDDIPNPIPHADKVWRPLMQIGYSVKDDSGKLTFQSHDQMIGRAED